jgi:hypothetical protein
MLRISCRRASSAEYLRSRVTDEGGSHLESSGSNVTIKSACITVSYHMHSPLSGRDVSGDPLDEVGRVLALNSLDLLLDLLHRDLSSEVASDSEVSLYVS